MTEPMLFCLDPEGTVVPVPIEDYTPVSGVEIPELGVHDLDDLDDVDGAATGLVGQALVKSPDGIWRPATVSGDGGVASLVFTQNTPAATWSIPHNLGRYPQVTVVDTSGRRLLPDLEYPSLTAVTVTHAEPLAGAAYLT